MILLNLNISTGFHNFNINRYPACIEQYQATVKNENQTKLEDLIKDENDRVAKELFDKVRVTCWIMTSPSNLYSKAIHLKNTWTKKCHKVLFMSSAKNETFPTVGLRTLEGREHLTAKTMQALQYLYDHNFNDSDWFLKADDDTYVIMENLRYFLSDENPNEPVYFGQIFKFKETNFLYASGGAGYVMSRESLRRFGERADNLNQSCLSDLGFEDIEVARCLMSLGVGLKSTFDNHDRHRFHWTTPEMYRSNKLPDEFKKSYDPEGGRGGIDSMSNYPITFHYITGEKMYDLEYYLYHIRPYGILNLPLQLNNITNV
ncbi:Glycoprotein-N-acetylgalactosamine 3-beta-galactosyltransferase 1 [Bulinus truncatus]|nr:Glycoprotein-N-acetylgalactosamine 3-beta-galactosyltransferase 1 [Bulinus truncatus]